MIYFCFFLTIFLTIYTLFVYNDERKQRMKRRLSFYINSENEPPAEIQDLPKDAAFLTRIAAPLWRTFKRSLKRRILGVKEAKIDLKLLQAGVPYGMTPVDYRLIQVTLCILLPIIGGIYGYLFGVGLGAGFLFVSGGLVLAMVIPSMYIRGRIKKRGYLALRELPDVLDLLVVSLEAGLGFDSALSKLVSKKKGVLANEFGRCLEEIRLGRTRREALLGVRERVVLQEIRSLINSILQAEKLGIGLVQVLRVQSSEVRDQRKQRAEEAAMKAPIKILFPLVLFIFPSLFIILLGPVVIQFMDTFGK